jgi:HEAT repeat protein
MPSRLPLAPLLGALIHLTRYEPAATDAQAALLAAIRGFLGDGPLHIRAESEALLLNEESISLKLPGATVLNEQLLLHGLSSVELPAATDEADLLRLARVLAGFAGTYTSFQDVVAAMGASAERIRLVAAEDQLGVQKVSARAAGDSAAQKARQREALEIRLGDAEAISLDPAAAGAAEVELPAEMPTRERPALGAILTRGRAAVAQEDWNGVLDAALQLIEAEDEAPSDRTGQTYRLELKRLVTQDHLGMLARLAHGERRQEVVGVLRRFGNAGTETLVELLVSSPDLSERRSYYTAITQMRAGAEAIFGRLEHPLWYVVRNAAELCGDMEISDAVPALGRQIRHPDERVRKSVAAALGRIGTPLALQWVRKMLADAEPAVCRQALVHLGGPVARELVSAIAELLDRETTIEVQREALLALGRIGSEDAIAVLAAWAAPTSKRFGRNPLPLRLFAVKGLALAGPGAEAALSALSRDEAMEIRTPASEALAALRP